MTEKWRLELEHAMACNCNWGWPCSFESPPTYGTVWQSLTPRIPWCSSLLVRSN